MSWHQRPSLGQTKQPLHDLTFFVGHMKLFDYSYLYESIYVLDYIPEIREPLGNGGFKVVEQDWSGAIWSTYISTNERAGESYLRVVNKKNWSGNGEAIYRSYIDLALTAVSQLPLEQIGFQIKRLQKLELDISTQFLTDRRYDIEDLENRQVRLSDFNRFVSEFFYTTSYPNTDKGDAYLYIDDKFYFTSELILQRKVEAVRGLIRQIVEITGLTTIDEAVAPPNELSLLDWVEQPNKFNSPMPLLTVRKYFMQLSNSPRKNRGAFLTPDEVNLFVRRAFVKEKGIGEMTLKVGPKDQLYVWKIFYQLYDYCLLNHYEDTSQCREDYIRLLTDNFTNYDFDKVRANFGSGKCKRSWKTPDQLG